MTIFVASIIYSVLLSNFMNAPHMELKNIKQK